MTDQEFWDRAACAAIQMIPHGISWHSIGSPPPIDINVRHWNDYEIQWRAERFAWIAGGIADALLAERQRRAENEQE